MECLLPSCICGPKRTHDNLGRSAPGFRAVMESKMPGSWEVMESKTAGKNHVKKRNGGSRDTAIPNIEGTCSANSRPEPGRLRVWL